ncbi:MAG TPA: APC family permease [Opitutaceae bacterium]|jgi:APA family basic amino acid/polyamine antiporter|nr:APC family permease [Opitutaceae bacterium]
MPQSRFNPQPVKTMPEASSSTPTMKPTLGLTGLTVNAMALIAPGAFLWLTYEEQCLYGAPAAGCAMFFGFFVSLLLCYATAISYAELSKLYPGAGSSYFYAEQAFLSKTHAFKFARVIKFFTGWTSHLYYWAYPGLMVGVTALLIGYLAGLLFPDTFSSVYNSPLLMYGFCIVFAIGVSYIAYRGVVGSAMVNIAVNAIQITALVIFAVIAIAYRLQHKQGSVGYHLSNGVAVNYQVAQTNILDDKGAPEPVLDAKGNPTKNADGTPAYQQQDAQDSDGNPVPGDANGKATTVDKAAPFTIDYTGAWSTDSNNNAQFNYHPTAMSVVAPHKFSYVFVQACIAILCLVGFESVTAMGEEAKNPKKDIPWAILLSLTIQGAICYLFEYFATNYLLNNGYNMSSAGASGAPIGDLMVITGTWLFGSYKAGKAFMLVQAFTVFLALIGTTLACLSTGARVTYAMGRDEEVGGTFGLLHGKNLTPHKAIWALCILSIFIGMITVTTYLGGASPAALDKHNIWYSFGIFSQATYPWIPNSLLIVTLISNLGTFLLYMTTCIVAMVAFREHHMFHGIKHVVIPIFGLLANLACMLFYLVGPFSVAGMSWHEPYIALAVSILWIGGGFIYFAMKSKSKGKQMILTQKPATT